MTVYKISLLILALSNLSCSGRKQEKTEMEPVTIQAPLRNGDIIFQVSTSGQSKAIQQATGSKYSHMGIIFKNKEQYFVYEAIQPVSYTPLDKWINRGKSGHYVVKRLKQADLIMNSKTLKKMEVAGKKYFGKNYDLYFEWSDKNIYYSELVWKIYKEATGLTIGELQPLKTFDLTSGPVKKKMYERYGNQIPLEEKAISPVAMFNSPLLVTVAKN